MMISRSITIYRNSTRAIVQLKSCVARSGAMPPPSALWTFAHRALSPQFHGDPAGFVAALDGNAAPRYLEQMWSWALGAAGVTEPARPPLTYEVQRLANGVVVRMR